MAGLAALVACREKVAAPGALLLISERCLVRAEPVLFHACRFEWVGSAAYCLHDVGACEADGEDAEQGPKSGLGDAALQAGAEVAADQAAESAQQSDRPVGG